MKKLVERLISGETMTKQNQIQKRLDEVTDWLPPDGELTFDCRTEGSRFRVEIKVCSPRLNFQGVYDAQTFAQAMSQALKTVAIDLAHWRAVRAFEADGWPALNGWS